MLRELSGLSIESLRVRPVCVDQAWPIVVLSAVKVHTPTRLRIVEGGKHRGNDEAPVGNLSIFKALHCTCRTCRVLQLKVYRCCTINKLSNTTSSLAMDPWIFSVMTLADTR